MTAAARLRGLLPRQRLLSVVLLTLVPGLVLPSIFLLSLWEYSQISLRLPWDVARFRVLKDGQLANVEFLMEHKRDQLLRVMGFNDATERAVTPRPWADDEIHIDLPDSSKQALEADLPRSGEDYQPASILTTAGYQRAQLRYRGDSGWHWLHPKKSFKLRTPRRQLFRGRRVLNLTLKRPYTMAFLFDVARELGLLAPDAAPVRVFLNGQYHGVEACVEQVDESFLLSHRRMPGTIWKGEAYPASNEFHHGSRVAWLFHDPYQWTKSARDNTRPVDEREELLDLTRLVSLTRPENHARLRGLFDLDAAARHLAYKFLLNEFHQDDRHNQKWYLDPTTGKLVPIVWDPRLQNNTFSLKTPLHRRVPLAGQEPSPVLTSQYYALGADPRVMQRVFEVLHQRAGRPDGLRARWKRLRAHAERHADAFAVEQINVLFPLSPGVLDEAWAHLEANRRRLMQRIGQARLRVLTRDGALVLGTRALAGVSVKVLQLTWAGDPADLKVIADRNRNLRRDRGERALPGKLLRIAPGRYRLELDPPLLLLPAYSGLVRLRTLALPYPLLLPSGARLQAARADNAVTGLKVPVVGVERWDPADTDSLHPWDDPAQGSEPPEVVLDHPVHVVREDLFVAGTLRVRPGTEVRMAPGVSIRCAGKVLAEGTATRPIRWRPAEPGRVWGVLALQGAGASGSRFSHVSFEGGTRAVLERVRYPGMVTVHHARDVRFNDCRFRGNRLGDDALRAAHAQVVVRTCQFEGVNGDGIDLDYSSGSIRFCRFERIGNDAIDLMRSDPIVQGCRIQECGDKGISIGERSNPVLFDTRITRCPVGVQIKDRSDPILLNLEVTRCDRGVDASRKNWRYGAGGRGWVVASRIAGNGRDLTVDPESRLEVHGSTVERPDPHALGAGRLSITPSDPKSGPHPLFDLDPAPPGLARARELLRRRPTLIEQRFQDGFQLETRGWELQGGDRVWTEEDALRALIPAEGSLVWKPNLRVPPGSRLHLRLSAASPITVELSLTGGTHRASARVTRSLDLDPRARWFHVDLSGGTLSRVVIRASRPVALGLSALRVTRPIR